MKGRLRSSGRWVVQTLGESYMPRKRGAKRPISMPIASRKRRRNPESALGSVTSSKLWADIGGNGLLHGIGGYGGTRLTGRIVRNIIAKKWPNLAKHGGVIGNLIAAVAIYFAVKNWRKIRDEAMLGSAIAVVQSILQTYLPGLAWLFDADAQPFLGVTTTQTAPAGLNGVAGRKRTRFVSPGELEAVRAEQGTRFVSPGEPGSGYGAPVNSTSESPPANDSLDLSDEQIADLGDGEELEDLNQGVFAGGF
jgi:hypothetical protein